MMLYPKSAKAFDMADFENPSSEYRATPFWAWNTKLEPAELVWQIEQLKKLGFGGFHIHVRTGLATPYLGDEFMEAVRVCVEKARVENMLVWLYDEDRWPSGAAGGLVTRNERYRMRHLLLTRHPYGEVPAGAAENTSRAAAGRTGNGALLSCFDVRLAADGSLESYRRIGEAEAADGIKLYAYAETSLPSAWFNRQTYVNTLDPAAVKEFLRITHERYASRFAAFFGALIPAIFTDEPQFSRKGTLGFSFEDRDVTLPWTDDLEETYKAAYHGESLVNALPELLWDLSGGRVSVIRYHYHDHTGERFAQAFADQCGAWCAEHGLMLTGHLMEEPTLESQTGALTEAMRSYRAFQLPGIDMLCDWREFTTAKQAASAARQNGRPGVLSELYGVTNWDFDFRGHKLQGDWQAALGVTVRVPHLAWVSMNGEAKRDYPASLNYQSPWYEQYPYIENHFARAACALTRGKAVVRVGVIHPIESYWLHWGPRQNTQDIRAEMDERFTRLCSWLLRGLIDFDYIAESTLPRLCERSSLRADSFPVGEMSYQVVIVPALETIRQSTLERLEAFRNSGGALIFLGDAPRCMDGYPNDGGLKLYERSEHLAFERYPLLRVLEGVRGIDIRVLSGGQVGERTDNLLYQLREEADGARWLFIAHADKPANPDIPQRQDVRVSVRGSWQAVFFDTLSGTAAPLTTESAGGWTSFTREFYEHDSLLVRLEPPEAPAIPRAESPQRPSPAEETAENGAGSWKEGERHSLESAFLTDVTAPVPVTLHEPNVLLLDMAECSLDGGPWSAKEEILRLDSALRSRLGWQPRGGEAPQPWAEAGAGSGSEAHTLELRCTFVSEVSLSGARLGLENAESAKVTLNGQAAGPIDGFYVDHSIDTLSLPDIAAGENTLLVTLPYRRAANLEALYLLGEFGVRIAGRACTLTPPVRSLAFADITTQGLPFYGGSLSYHLQARTGRGGLTLEASAWRSPLLRLKVDSRDAGVIAFSPYRLSLLGLPPGEHEIEIIAYGSRVNTFGQVHTLQDHHGTWWGPDSWRTTGPAWTYTYRLWPQGLLIPPRLLP